MGRCQPTTPGLSDRVRRLRSEDGGEGGLGGHPPCCHGLMVVGCVLFNHGSNSNLLSTFNLLFLTRYMHFHKYTYQPYLCNHLQKVKIKKSRQTSHYRRRVSYHRKNSMLGDVQRQQNSFGSFFFFSSTKQHGLVI